MRIDINHALRVPALVPTWDGPEPWTTAAVTVAGVGLCGVGAALAAHAASGLHVFNPAIALPVSLGCTATSLRWLSPYASGRPRTVPGDGTVALTFDDGPDPDHTPAILRALDRRQARATFFLLGKRVAAWPGLTADIARAGHSTGLHGWNHDPLTLKFGALGEVQRAKDVLERATDRPVRWFRPPFGFRGPVVQGLERHLGLSGVGWRSGGWEWRAPNADALTERLTRAIRPRDIVLMHDGGSGGALMASALPHVLAHLHAVGMRPVTLDDALGERP